MAQVGTYGLERRQETEDANAGARVPPAAQINVGGVRTPAVGDFSRMTTATSELARSLGSFEATVGDVFAQQRQDWRIEGQLAAAQGKTEEEIAAEGNFFTAQGAKVFNAQTAFQDWASEAMANIDYQDHQEDPTAYRERLTKQFSDMSGKLSGDKLVQKFASDQASAILPKLIAAQTVAHNKFNRDNLRTAFTNNLVSSAGMIGPDTPGQDMLELKEKLDPGMSVLPINEHNLAVSAAVATELTNGSSHLYDAIGGRDGMASMGFTPDAISGVEQTYRAFQQKQQLDFNNAQQERQKDILNKAYDSKDINYAGNLVNEYLKDNRGTPQWARFVAGSTDRATIGLALDKLHPEDTGAQSTARLDRMMGVFDELTALYADTATGTANGTAKTEAFTGRAQALAAKTGLPQQDIEQMMAVFGETDNRIGIDLTTSVRKTVSSELEAAHKLNTGLTAWATGTLKSLPEGQQQEIIAAKWAEEFQKGQAAIASGQGGDKTANQIAEANIIPHLAAMGIVDKGMKDSINNSFVASVIDPKTNVISQNAISAYDTLRRFQQEYGLTPAQIDGYIDGYGSKLYHQAMALDIGDMDSATALTAAKNLIDRPEDISMFQEKIDNDKVKDAAREIVGGWWGVGGVAGMINRFNSQGFRGLSMTLREEVMRAGEGPEFLAAIRAEAMLQKATNPSMTPEGALRKATATIQNRSTFISGTMVTTRPGAKTVPQAMGLDSYDNFTPNAAVMLYMREHGKELFGSAWDASHIWDGKAESWYLTDGGSGETVGGNIMTNIQKSDILGRGAPQFRTRYDSDSGTFIFELYADNTMQATIPSGKFVSAKEIGDAYRKAERDSGLKGAAFWNDVMKSAYKAAPKALPFVPTPILLQEK